MTSRTLTLIDNFGDAHLRYATRAGVLIDVVREPRGQWVAYQMQPDMQVGHEVADAANEAALMATLDRQFQ